MEITNFNEAWEHFWNNGLPTGEDWLALPESARNEICQAGRDYNRKRKDKSGKVVNLTMKRAKRIMEQYAPDKYEIEIRFICRVKE